MGLRGSLVARMGTEGRPGRGDPVGVLIVDEHPVFRGVVRLACEASPALEVVGEAGDGQRALEAIRRLRPDVVVIDLALPAIDGLEVARRLRRDGLGTGVLVLTARHDDEAVLGCIRAGADGYLSKTAGVGLIREAIETVASGGRVFTPEQERAAIEELGRMARQAREASGVAASLTPRELEILGLVARGLTMKQVASRLGVSPRTVESHIAKLYRKLGVRTRVQAVARGAQLGLVDLG